VDPVEIESPLELVERYYQTELLFTKNGRRKSAAAQGQLSLF